MQPAKRVDIVRIQLVKERGIQYKGRYLRSPRDVSNLMIDHLQMDQMERESLVAVAINIRHEPTHVEVVSTGSLTASIVHPREVFKMAILSNAYAIFLCHNHPSGDPRPSEDDRKITLRLKEAGELMGIPIIDHVVMGENGTFYSFKESGVI